MARRLSDRQRGAIAADLRRGHKTQAEIAANHKISRRTVGNIAAQAKSEVPADVVNRDPLVERLDRLVEASENMLDMAERSNDGRQLSAAIRAARDTMAAVAKMRADIEREAEGGTRDDIELVKRVILEELHDHPDIRQRVAERLLKARSDARRPG